MFVVEDPEPQTDRLQPSRQVWVSECDRVRLTFSFLVTARVCLEKKGKKVFLFQNIHVEIELQVSVCVCV